MIAISRRFKFYWRGGPELPARDLTLLQGDCCLAELWFRSMVKEEKRPPIQWGNRYSNGEIKAINNDREKHARE